MSNKINNIPTSALKNFEKSKSLETRIEFYDKLVKQHFQFCTTF